MVGPEKLDNYLNIFLLKNLQNLKLNISNLSNLRLLIFCIIDELLNLSVDASLENPPDENR